jgi:hypothetical protein
MMLARDMLRLLGCLVWTSFISALSTRLTDYSIRICRALGNMSRAVPVILPASFDGPVSETSALLYIAIVAPHALSMSEASRVHC